LFVHLRLVLMRAKLAPTREKYPRSRTGSPPSIGISSPRLCHSPWHTRRPCQGITAMDNKLTFALILALISFSLAQQRRGGEDVSDALHLSWNEVSKRSVNVPKVTPFLKVHSHVRNAFRDVYELKQEHNRIYRDLDDCYGLESCLHGMRRSPPRKENELVDQSD